MPLGAFGEKVGEVGLTQFYTLGINLDGTAHVLQELIPSDSVMHDCIRSRCNFFELDVVFVLEWYRFKSHLLGIEN